MPAKTSWEFPALSSVHGGTLVKFELAVCEGVDIVFCCLPHRVAMNTVPSLLEAGHRVVDFSADYRLRDFGVYEAWYKTKHTSPERIADAVYGVPELYREEITKARLVANPGCYPTGAISGPDPAFEGGTHQAGPIIVDANLAYQARKKSGLELQFSEVNEGFKAIWRGDPSSYARN